MLCKRLGCLHRKLELATGEISTVGFSANSFPQEDSGAKKMGPFGLVRPFRGVEVSYFPLYWLVNGDSMVYYNPYISG